MFQDIDPDILEAANLVENEYQEFFKEKLKEYGIKSPNELDYDKAQEFFNDIKKNWHGNSVNEEDEEENTINEGFDDVYASTYNHLINPNTLGVGDIVSFPYSGFDTQFKIELIVNPSCYGMPTIYHLKALNGPFNGNEYSFDQSFINGIMNESEEDEEEDINMDRVVEALENDEKFSKDDIISEEDEDVKDDEKEALEESNKSLKESTDFDVTNEDDKTLESLLKVFLKAKALDGEDYEITSKGNKLILKVYNKKYVKDIEDLLGGK